MKPFVKLAESKTTGGTISLYQHDGEFSIHFNGLGLMHSKANASEILMGQLGVAKLKPEKENHVLIGGLGLGFTLRAVLQHTNKKTEIDVIELIPAVIDWNHDQLKDLNGSLLKEKRVQTHTQDVTKLIRNAQPASWDVILLDIDNGPDAIVSTNNASLYSKQGITSVLKALKPGGRAIFWSSNKDKAFETRLRMAGLKVELVPAMMHPKAKKPSYSLYIADKRKSAASHKN